MTAAILPVRPTSPPLPRWGMPSPVGPDRPVPLAGPAPRPGWSSFLLLQVLDTLAVGLLVVGGDGRLRMANRAARGWCTPGQPVVIDGATLQVRPEARMRLQSALQAARGGQWTMVTLGGAAGPPWHLALVPLPDEADADEPGSCPVLAVLGVPGGVSELGLQFFGRQHQFTPAEMQVLRALAAGASPAEIAREGQVALCTVRTQIAAMREKAGAPTLRHLLLMLAGLPPITTLFGGR